MVYLETTLLTLGLLIVLGAYAHYWRRTGDWRGVARFWARGMALSVVRLDPKDLTRPVLFAILVICIAAFADTRTGVMTRPQDLYLTQAAIAFAAVFAMGPIMMEGMLRALREPAEYRARFDELARIEFPSPSEMAAHYLDSYSSLGVGLTADTEPEA